MNWFNFLREVLEGKGKGDEGGCPESGECFESSPSPNNLTCTLTVLDSKEGKYNATSTQSINKGRSLRENPQL